jgi:hypothetical protein
LFPLVCLVSSLSAASKWSISLFLAAPALPLHARTLLSAPRS